MVPGMTERERLATEERRGAWLAEAIRGPAHRTGAPVHLVAPFGLWHAVVKDQIRRGWAGAHQRQAGSLFRAALAKPRPVRPGEGHLT